MTVEKWGWSREGLRSIRRLCELREKSILSCDGGGQWEHSLDPVTVVLIKE